MLQSLSHPALVQVEDIYEIELEPSAGFGVRYRALPPSVQEHLQNHKRFAPQEIKQLLHNALVALQELHTLSPPFIHGNISPETLHWEPETYTVQFSNPLGDFTLNLPDDVTYDPLHPYFSPEQLHQLCDARSDLYSLGLTLLHIITAKPPEKLRGIDSYLDLETSHDDTMMWVLEMLTEDLEARPASAQEALEALNDTSSGRGCLLALLIVVIAVPAALVTGLYFLLF